MTRCPEAAGRERGVALVIVLLVLAALSLAAVALLGRSGRNLSAQASTTQLVQCQNVAELGAVEGAQKLPGSIYSLLAGLTFLPQSELFLSSGSVPMGAGSASYLVTVRGGDPVGLPVLGDQDMILRSTCGFGQTRVVVEAEGRLGMESLFQRGGCACDDAFADSSGGTDAYLSTLGTYESQTPTAGGSLGANDDVHVTGSGTIAGGIVAGANLYRSAGTIVGSTVAGGENQAGGASNQSPAPRPCSCNVYPIVTELAEAAITNHNLFAGDCLPHILGTSLAMGAGDRCTLPSGTYFFTNLQLSGDADLQVSGPVTIFLASVPLLSNFQVRDDAVINTSDRAGDLQILSLAGMPIRVGDRARVAAYYYGPSDVLRLADDAAFFGAAVTEDLYLQNSATLHFDQRARSEEHLPAGFQARTWKTLR